MTTFRLVSNVSSADTALQDMSYSPAATPSGGVTDTVMPLLAPDSTSRAATLAVSPVGVKLTPQPDGALDDKL